MTNGTQLAQQWTALWNGDYDLADQILTPDFQVLFASDAPALRGPEGFLSFLRPWRESALASGSSSKALRSRTRTPSAPRSGGTSAMTRSGKARAGWTSSAAPTGGSPGCGR